LAKFQGEIYASVELIQTDLEGKDSEN